jgi:hypothetical protein
MYIRALESKASPKTISYFREESTRYKEYMTYKQYVTIRNPKTQWKALKDKWMYLLYILLLRTKKRCEIKKLI